MNYEVKYARIDGIPMKKNDITYTYDILVYTGIVGDTYQFYKVDKTTFEFFKTDTAEQIEGKMLVVAAAYVVEHYPNT